MRARDALSFLYLLWWCSTAAFALPTRLPTKALSRLRGGINNDMAAIEENSPKKRVLVAGGAGYIGTHTLIELLSAGQPVVVVDNLCNSDPEGLKRVREITGVSVMYICLPHHFRSLSP
jgi:hypothetical protein